VGHVARMEEAFTGFCMGGPKGRPRRRWMDNIKMYLSEVRIGGANWIRLAEDRKISRPYSNPV
jgi:hypothetical protein